MKRIGTTDGRFVDGTRRSPGTAVTADWLNGMQEAIALVCEHFDGAVDESNDAQLLDILTKRVAGNYTSIAALRAGKGGKVGQIANVTGYYAGYPGKGGGQFVAVNDTKLSDDGGSIIVDSAGMRWVRLTNRLTLHDFGAIGDGTTDDTAAVQAAVSSGRALNIGIGLYAVNKPVTLSGQSVTWSGDNQYRSRFLLGAAGMFDFACGAGGSEYNSNHVSISGVGIVCAAANTQAALMKIAFSGGSGGTAQHVTLRDMQFSTVADGGSYVCGLSLVNTRNLTLESLRLMGDRDAAPVISQVGISIYGDADAAPVELFINKVQCYFLQTALKIRGWVEGLYIDSITAIACRQGIDGSATPANRPLLHVVNSHFNCQNAGIVLSDFVQVKIEHNLLYASTLDDSSADYVAIQMTHSPSASAEAANGTICNNTVMAIMGVNKNGIVINDQRATKITNYSIEGNKLNGLNGAGVWIAAGSGVFVGDSNQYIGCVNKVINQGTNNFIASHNSSTTDRKAQADGTYTAWGTTVAYIATGGKADVPVGGAGKLLSAVVCNGDYNAHSEKVVSLDFDKSDAATLKVKVTPSPTVGDTVRINWQIVYKMAEPY